VLGGANVNATTHTGATVSVTGNITGGNIAATNHTGTTVSVTGNITGGNVIITGVLVDNIGNLELQSTATNGNINLTPNGVGIVGITTSLSVAGNITGGNVLGGANVNATTHTGDTVSVTGNVTGGNVLSGAVVSAVGNATILSGTAIPAGGTTGAGYKFSSTTNLGVFFGSGSPTLSAAQGSLYLRTDGTSTNDRMYINTNGGTTWTAVTTAA
jgi:hypothetical protein